MDESNPEVHSTPSAVGTRMRYRNLKFRFLTQLTLSALEIWIRRDSPCPSLEGIGPIFTWLYRHAKLVSPEKTSRRDR